MTAADFDDIPFLDAHHHFWDPVANDHPWLRGAEPIAFRYGDYSAIKGRYLPEHYRADAAGHAIAGHVTMEGEWAEHDPVAESRWISGLARTYPALLGHVARAFLNRDDVSEVLHGHAQFPIVRAIRHKPTAAARPDLVERRLPGSMSDPAWQRGYAMLQAHGFHFELQAPWWHADELLDLIDRFPQTPVVINHTFLPSDRTPEGLAGWRAALQRVAAAPQVAIKISGIGLEGVPWRLADNRAIIRETIEIFGPDRAMFASNFPVDKLTGAFDTILSGYQAATAGLARADRCKLFRDTALRIYRLEPPTCA